MPKEIYTLSKRKPIYVSAGESHSAAITEKLNLYTWGYKGKGLLGREINEDSQYPLGVHISTIRTSLNDLQLLQF